MSGASRKPDAKANLPAQYEVGYAKPPAEHRFRKGQSGNPDGRPKGAANKPKIDTGYGQMPTSQYLREEAYRTVVLREGEKVIELPAIQAVFRAMGVSAMKGNRFAQRTMAELVTRLEADDHRSRMELFGTYVDYKHQWSEEIKRCQRIGITVPDPLPHPDDIILNPNTGEVHFAGPLTAEHKKKLDTAIERRAEAQEEVDYFAEKYRRARDPARKSRYLEDWHWEQRMFDILNDIVPERCKAQLQNRSYREGASREGKALKELLANRALRAEYVE